MPQLDQFTYLTQFVWLCLSFMGYYIYVYNYSLPKISRILKLRARLVSIQSQASENISIGNQDEVLAESLKNSVTYLNTSIAGASTWCNDMITQFNTNQLEPYNKIYMQSLASMSLSQLSKSKTLDKLSALTSTSLPSGSLLNSILVIRLLKTAKKKK